MSVCCYALLCYFFNSVQISAELRADLRQELAASLLAQDAAERKQRQAEQGTIFWFCVLSVGLWWFSLLQVYLCL